MQLIHKVSLVKLFLTAFVATVILFICDIVITNRLSTNNGRIGCDVVIAILASSLFLVGSVSAAKQKRRDWLALNILLIIIIVAVAAWSILLEYAFRDFKLVLPD